MAELEDFDLFADVTEHDGETWQNDVFELFFKPHDERTGYYEFQVNAANTTLDVYMPARSPGGYQRYKSAHPFRMKTAVVQRGTLN